MIDGEWPLPHGGGWAKWVESWQTMGESVDVTWISYEGLSRMPVTELYWMLIKIGVEDVDPDKLPVMLNDVVERQSFTSRRQWTELHGDSLNYGKEFQLRFLRRGIVGDWRNHDWGGCYELAMDAWGEMMEALGYE
jgi:hypothetical protein